MIDLFRYVRSLVLGHFGSSSLDFCNPAPAVTVPELLPMLKKASKMGSIWPDRVSSPQRLTFDPRWTTLLLTDEDAILQYMLVVSRCITRTRTKVRKVNSSRWGFLAKPTTVRRTDSLDSNFGRRVSISDGRKHSTLLAIMSVNSIEHADFRFAVRSKQPNSIHHSRS